MQKVFIGLLFLFCTTQLHAQSRKKPSNNFPESFIGNWKGEIKWHKIAKDTPQIIKMQLRVQPADSVGHYTWHLIYGEGNKDDRPYILKPVDIKKGHWIVDERNGILIDQYYIGNRFFGAFTVQSKTIISQFWREGNKLVVEFYAATAKPVSTTGLNTEDSPIVNSYGVDAYQRAELIRITKL
ncbi:MAG: hypothetical protein WCF67_02565 [Chitinophagaceae bacterium]